MPLRTATPWQPTNARRGVALYLLVASMVTTLSCGAEGERSQAAYCDELRKVRSDLAGERNLRDPKVIRGVADAFDRLEARAPDQIRKDVSDVGAEIEQIADLVDEAKGDVSRVDRRRLVEIVRPHKDANDRVNAYNKDRCGVDTTSPSLR